MNEAVFEDHFRAVSPEVRRRLEQVAAEVERRTPGAARCISYQMPAFRLPPEASADGTGHRRRERPAGRIFFYFAAFKKHIGVYPPLRGPQDLLDRLQSHLGPKGNLTFPHAEPLPLDLLGEVAESLAEQYRRGRS